MEKKCSRCKEKLPATTKYFGRDNRHSDKLRSRCRECVREYNREYNKRNSEKNKRKSKRYYNTHPRDKNYEKNKKYLRYYGITLKAYNILHELQDGKCAICGKKERVIQHGKPRSLTIDHDHNTNKIRELLCVTCNSGLGFFNDDIELLKVGIEYLKKHKKGG